VAAYREVVVEPVYATVIAIITAAFRLLGWRIDVQGAEHIPRSGAGVIATNHVGYLDFTFVGYAAHRRRRLVRFLAKREVFDRRVAGWLMRRMRHIPVDRFGKAAESYTASVTALQRGELIGMFPEATISRSFVPAAAKTGAARMAMAAGVPLIPGAVWGSQRLLTKGRKPNLQRGVAISVFLGAPVPYEADEDPAEVTRRLMTRVGELLAAAQETYPQVPAGDDDRWWLPAHLGGTAPTVAEADAAATAERAARLEERRAARGR
jgi:1-acyl-sn-glycerol-3-phosphate acyltransferase